ncbi:MAG: hypothetical protein JO017_08210 [Actinobacteria bacterium]|nr:hypothetical protein [Actinomycetota bacterium]
MIALTPTPIGPGPAYSPPSPRTALVCAQKPVARVHVELFANGYAIVIPSGIGSCGDALRTRTPTGVVELTRTPLALGDLFRIWRQPLGVHRLLSFSSTTPVRAYVNGRRAADPLRVALTPGAEIVLELGAYVPPHTSFLFPRSLR